MPLVRLRRKFEAEQWITTNTAQIMDWIRRDQAASFRWYPAFPAQEVEENGTTEIPDWWRIPEHLIIVHKNRIVTVAPYAWIIRDESGLYRAISDEEFRSEFEPTT